MNKVISTIALIFGIIILTQVHLMSLEDAQLGLYIYASGLAIQNILDLLND